jgi:hypothetical protein
MRFKAGEECDGWEGLSNRESGGGVVADVFVKGRRESWRALWDGAPGAGRLCPAEARGGLVGAMRDGKRRRALGDRSAD